MAGVKKGKSYKKVIFLRMMGKINEHFKNSRSLLGRAIFLPAWKIALWDFEFFTFCKEENSFLPEISFVLFFFPQGRKNHSSHVTLRILVKKAIIQGFLKLFCMPKQHAIYCFLSPKSQISTSARYCEENAPRAIQEQKQEWKIPVSLIAWKEWKT